MLNFITLFKLINWPLQTCRTTMFVLCKAAAETVQYCISYCILSHKKYNQNMSKVDYCSVNNYTHTHTHKTLYQSDVYWRQPVRSLHRGLSLARPVSLCVWVGGLLSWLSCRDEWHPTLFCCSPQHLSFHLFLEILVKVKCRRILIRNVIYGGEQITLYPCRN